MSEVWGCGLAEKYSIESNLRRTKLRIISGITALNLIKEKRFAEAEVYIKPFIEIKDSSVEEVALDLGFGFVPNPNETNNIAAEMISIAKSISQHVRTLETNEIERITRRLVELLNDISNTSRI
jgi:hypothetical protein